MALHIRLVGRKDLSGEFCRQVRRAILDALPRKVRAGYVTPSLHSRGVETRGARESNGRGGKCEPCFA
jgi:hypothetical protein